MIGLKFFGLGGQGVVTAAKMFSEAYSLYEGHYAITIPAYGHERRGAPVNTSIIADDLPVRQNCFVYEPDIVMVVDSSVIDKGIDISKGIKANSILVLNSNKETELERYGKLGFKKVYFVDGTGLAWKNIGMGIPNAAMLGALAKTGIVGINAVANAITDTFGKKAGEKNAKAAREAYEKTECR
jgi:2-oxoacid:acceptor oxidoreductase gamma subunit (pyruvate/2-ketoisovalerate family)